MTVEDFIAFLTERGIYNEYTMCIKSRYGDNVTVYDVWNSESHRGIIDQSLH